MKLSAEPLAGRFVRLEPYAEDLRDELRAALDVDPEGWGLMSSSAQGARFDAWWATALAEVDAGERIPFAVRLLATGEVVGTTSWLAIRPSHRGVEVGATFYRPEARSGVVNPDCKRLLLGAAFAAGAARVELVADARNRRSRAAILKLGATPEGVLRRHKITWTGHSRDTAVFSILEDEWPGVRDRLETRLTAFEVAA